MAASAEIFLEHDSWSRPLAWSAVLHVGVAVLIAGYTLIHPGGRGESWGAGGGGDAMGATLVSTIPLPSTGSQAENVLANESKGLSQSQPKIEEKEPEAIPIPDKESRQKPKPAASASKAKAQPVTEETNQIPFGQGGPVSGP